MHGYYSVPEWPQKKKKKKEAQQSLKGPEEVE